MKLGFWKTLVLLFVFALSMTGCYFNNEVNTNQVAVHLDKNKIVEVVGPGVYSEVLCFFCDQKELDVDTLTFSVEDPEVLTKDNQAVGVKITIQARRKSDEASVRNFFTNWSLLTNNEVLVQTISATAREGMKNGTREYTLPDLLNDRNGLAGAISKSLEDDAQKYSVSIVNVTIENIAPSTQYMEILSQTANIKAQTDQEVRRQDLINQKAANDILQQQKNVQVSEAQVLAEQAKTEVEVEIASREGKLIAAKNSIYQTNEQAFELERLRLLKELFGNNTVYFLPEGTDPTMFFNFPENGLPVPSAGQ